ncbi:hypothetical protein ACFT7S_18305 [Streptomyces sp. NPDC057136]|uniref:hypothetical protein n=1 Tax=Streptomyces sp. NPDC057136 TaxID=3346029 RepID=UPI0036367EBA
MTYEARPHHPSADWWVTTDLCVGAGIEALLASGHLWAAIADALGADSPDEIRRLSENWRGDAREALEHRLAH